MTKKIIGSLLLGSLIFITGCGGSSGSNNEKNNENQEQPTNPQQNPNNELPNCTVNENTVLANEGETCQYQNDKLECKNGRVTLNNSISAKTININGITYKCSSK